MQKFILSIVVMLISFGVSAQDDSSEKSDTTKIKFKKSTIVITKDRHGDDEGIHDEDDEDDDRHGRHHHRHHNHDHWGLFSTHLGFLGYMAPDYEISLPDDQSLLELNYPISRTFGFTQYFPGLKIVKNRFHVQPGLGVSWNTYFFKNNINISTDNDSTRFTLNETIDYETYKLRITYLEVPLILSLKLGNLNRPFTFQAGAVGGFRIGSRVKEKYNLDGSKVKNKIKDDFNFNPVKLDAIVRMGVGELGIYARYSLTELFEENKAPELYPFSVGITAGFN